MFVQASQAKLGGMRRSTQVTVWYHSLWLYALGGLAIGLLGWCIALQVQIAQNPVFANLTTSTARELLLILNNASEGYEASTNIDDQNLLVMNTASGNTFGAVEFLFRISTTFVGDDNTEATLTITVPPERMHGLSFVQDGFPPSTLPLLFFGAANSIMYPQRAFVVMVDSNTRLSDAIYDDDHWRLFPRQRNWVPQTLAFALERPHNK